METAQEAFKRLIRDHLAPAFRAMGLRGSGTSYVLASDLYWIGVSLQGSKWNDRRRALFTLNMSFVSKKEWDELRGTWPDSLPARPSPSIAYPAGVSWRIGVVLQQGETWWVVRGDQALDELAEEITSIVRDGALPWLRQHVADPEYYKSSAARGMPGLRVKLGRFPTDFDLE